MVIPTGAVKHRHIPTPWIVGHSIFGLFIFTGGQINFYAKAYSGPPWLVAFLRNPHLVWMLWTLFTLSIQTVFSQRGWASQRFSWKPWHSLLPTPSLTSAPALQGVAMLIRSMVHITLLFWLPISLPLSMASTPNVIGHSWSLGVTCFFPVVALALWPLSSLPLPWGCHGNLPAQFSTKLLSALISWPSWMGLLSQTEHFLPCDREASHSWSTYQRTEWPPLETRPQLQLCGLPARLPGVCQWSNILPTHGKMGVDHLLCLPTLLLPVYNNVFQGRWVVSLMLKGYWPLRWWLASSPEPKRHFGGSIGVWKQLFPRSNLFYWVSYHVTFLPILQWWKGGGTFLQVCAPFVCSLTFPHTMAKASLMHC